jgi:hypothetical protein
MRALKVVGALVLMVLAGEVAARIDDLMREGTPLLAAPDHLRDLTARDSTGTHGRPGGRFQRWTLNQFGFRGPEMAQVPAGGCPRVMVLGASESFGYYERTGYEYPARLAEDLRPYGCFEVVNAALFGLTMANLVQLYVHYGATFHPAVVFVYPSPGFYLADDAPSYPQLPGTPIALDRRWWRPRVIGRLFDRLSFPRFLQRRRLEGMIASRRAEHGPEWLWSSVPGERVELFGRHLDSLVSAIEASGAKPILATQATRFANPPAPDDEFIMLDWRQFMARPSPQVALDFMRQADSAVTAIGRRHGVPVVDVAGAMSGHTAWFADATHFTEEGSARMAGLLAPVVAEAAGVRRP